MTELVDKSVPQPAATKRPVFIVAALLLASFVVGFDTRVFTVGLPDLRGAFGMGFDEGSWFYTAANAPQILIAPAVAWLITVYGVRRIMVPSSVVYSLLSLGIPVIHDHTLLIIAHMVRALLLGVFIPATLMIVFRNLQPKHWLIGLAIYTLRIPLSQGLGFVLVGYYGEDFGWQWLYWQDVLLAPLIGVFLVLGAPKEPIDRKRLRKADWGGMLLLGASMAFLYVGLDQGNRLDWLESGTIVSAMIAGGFLFFVFLVNEAVVAQPWAHVSVQRIRNVSLGLAAVTIFTFASATASSLIPGMMQTVTALRPYQIGDLFIWYAVIPSFFLVAIAGVALYFIDARIVLIIGMSITGVAAMMGTEVTSQWFPESFRPILLLSTAGQAMTYFASFVFLVGNSDPKTSTATSAYIQVCRLGSAELASSFIATLLRFREQFHSNALGIHLTDGSPLLRYQLSGLSHLLDRTGNGTAKALSTVSASARTQATVLAYSDSFFAAFWFAVAGLVVVALMTAAPKSPLSPRLFRTMPTN
ncbi:UNVERIFIED_ORG: DHA2 family multidrug resistance protein [Rhizobium sp. SORGH_AS260]|uniref:MFS transporter n=1 Tax=Agrobacterium sp. SORGH_AS_0440 TaxID=3041757 RepID=UPI002781B16F|nr:MFS transporter [Agrobacterium sp. SORGH_AS_0440]MDP9734563.1 DHA2 family multidrug resistance protein [Rhizobium sp. SORGH_AS_0285]MDP9756780.1 DHA2 family multidrug resistance protein [Rhizobium sp. SORGH_AS_0260]MDR6083969.1 DHA2 family multidrug resistance protein [Agrobacterium sp. SORGH_AS_0440]